MRRNQAKAMQNTNGSNKSGATVNLKKQFTENPLDDETPNNAGKNPASNKPYAVKNQLPPPPVGAG